MAIYDIADILFGSECMYICLCTIKTPEILKPPYFVKRTDSRVLKVPKQYKVHSIFRMLVYYFRKIVHYNQWIQRPGILILLLSL